jgi:ferredoxin
VARLLCAGGAGLARQDAVYVGLQTCAAAAAVAGGGKACAWGCLGYGDCVPVCDDDAIHMGSLALPLVDPARCTACGRCVDACPRELLELLPEAWPVLVQCRCALEGDEAEALCAVACTTCGKCVQDAPEGVLHVEGGLPRLDPTRVDELTPGVTARCPTGAITWFDGVQPAGRPREDAA